MDELRDSVVSGRFNAVSSLVRGEAAEGPEGLKERRGDGGSGKEAGSRRDKADKEWAEFHKQSCCKLLWLLIVLSSIFPRAVASLYAVFGTVRRGGTILTLCSVWGKCCSGRTRQHRRTHPRWRNRRSLARSVRGWGCVPGRRCRCWGLTGHSLTEKTNIMCHVSALLQRSFSFYGSN